MLQLSSMAFVAEHVLHKALPLPKIKFKYSVLIGQSNSEFWLDKMWLIWWHELVTWKWFIKSGMIIWFRDICKKWKYEFWKKFKNKKSWFRRENFKMENFAKWNTNCFMKMLSRDARHHTATPPTQDFRRKLILITWKDWKLYYPNRNLSCLETFRRVSYWIFTARSLIGWKIKSRNSIG